MKVFIICITLLMLTAVSGCAGIQNPFSSTDYVERISIQSNGQTIFEGENITAKNLKVNIPK